MLGMSGHMWHVNPRRYLDLLSVTPGFCRIFWTGKYLSDWRIDAHAVSRMRLRNVYHEYMILKEDEHLVEHWRGDDPRPELIGVYPAWNAAEDSQDWLDMMLEGLPGFFQSGVDGQQLAVWVYGVPNPRSASGKGYISLLSKKVRGAKARTYVLGDMSLRQIYSLGFEGCAIYMHNEVFKNALLLPSGFYAKLSHLGKYKAWLNAVGFTPSQLLLVKYRFPYMLAVYDYADKYFDKIAAMQDLSSGIVNLDLETPENRLKLPGIGEVNAKATRLLSLLEHRNKDKVGCDTCSLSARCTYAREGAVCTLPGSEGGALSAFFNTRDAETVKTGLSALLGKRADRLEEYMEEEQDKGIKSANVDKLMAELFKDGIVYAKLLAPPGPAVQVNVGTGVQAIEAGQPIDDPKQLMAQIMTEIEAQGIPRDLITPQVIRAFVASHSKYAALTAGVVDAE